MNGNGVSIFSLNIIDTTGMQLTILSLLSDGFFYTAPRIFGNSISFLSLIKINLCFSKNQRHGVNLPH